MRVLAVALDLVREARSRKWTLALLVATTAVLAAVALGLRMEVVDGALAATRLFGQTIDHSIRAVDVALRPLFMAAAGVVFYGGISLSILTTSDFAPALLAPGRIEHLLALPVRRWEFLAGTFLGVEGLVLGGALYGGGGLSIILWAKTGALNPGPILAAGVAAAGFAAIYAVMLAVALLVRSAALSGAAGHLLFFGGILAGFRAPLAELFSPGVGRSVFLGLTAVLPRLSSLAGAGIDLASGLPLRWGPLLASLCGAWLFAAAVLAFAISRFERKDF